MQHSPGGSFSLQAVGTGALDSRPGHTLSQRRIRGEFEEVNYRHDRIFLRLAVK